MTTLLPSNATKFERALEKTCATSFSLPVLIDTLSNPEKCPFEVLTWLAFGLSVDEWRPFESLLRGDETEEELNELRQRYEAQQRKVTAASVEVHRKKGTLSAVKAALGALDVKVDTLEWWEKGGSGKRGTFNLVMKVPEEEYLTKSIFKELLRVVSASKNCRSHLNTITFPRSAAGSVYTGGMCEVKRPVQGTVQHNASGRGGCGSVGVAYFLPRINCVSQYDISGHGGLDSAAVASFPPDFECVSQL